MNINISIERDSYKDFCYVIFRGIARIEEDVEFCKNRNNELYEMHKDHLEAAKSVYKQVFGRDYDGL